MQPQAYNWHLQLAGASPLQCQHYCQPHIKVHSTAYAVTEVVLLLRLPVSATSASKFSFLECGWAACANTRPQAVSFDSWSWAPHRYRYRSRYSPSVTPQFPHRLVVRFFVWVVLFSAMLTGYERRCFLPTLPLSSSYLSQCTDDNVDLQSNTPMLQRYRIIQLAPQVGTGGSLRLWTIILCLDTDRIRRS